MLILGMCACQLLVAEWVGIHGEHHFIHISTVFIRDIRDIHFVKLAVDVFTERCLFVSGVVDGILPVTVQKVGCDIIDSIDVVMGMYGVVNQCAYTFHKLNLVGNAAQIFQVAVDARRYVEVDVSLKSE